jgi:precorrin-6B C5,15-methyltransferase / cobalt-precorrin-6B C5,C15-methyltransferase
MGRLSLKMAKLTVVGIGYKPLDERARLSLTAAAYVLGSKRLIEVFERYPEYEINREKVKLIDGVNETMRFIHESFSRGIQEITLLGSGDPLFFGIGARAVRELGHEMVEIIPDLTSLQTAFSMIGAPWDDALFISFHGGPDPNKRRRLRYELQDLPDLIDAYDTIGILTDKENDPPAIARFLLSSVPLFPSLVLFVGEKMGYEDARITEGAPEEIASTSFVHPNVVIIKKTGDPSDRLQTQTTDLGLPTSPSPLPRFGLREAEISHSRGLITKDEVRAVAIHALRLPKEGVFWDVGAGSGAVSIEAARLCPGLDIFSIEKDAEQIKQIDRNKATFAASKVTIVPGEASAALSSLPAPDRVFIGGSGGKIGEILRIVADRITKGIVVINAATLETLNDAVVELEKTGFSVRVSQVSIARSKSIGDKRYLTALNPVFVITGEKQ